MNWQVQSIAFWYALESGASHCFIITLTNVECSKKYIKKKEKQLIDLKENYYVLGIFL
jgi:hypothetical protein